MCHAQMVELVDLPTGRQARKVEGKLFIELHFTPRWWNW